MVRCNIGGGRRAVWAHFLAEKYHAAQCCSEPWALAFGGGVGSIGNKTAWLEPVVKSGASHAVNVVCNLGWVLSGLLV